MSVGQIRAGRRVVSAHCDDAGEGPIDSAIGLAVVAVLVAANAFFVASEFALVAADRAEVESRAQEGSRAARLVQGLLRRLSFYLSGAQLGITVSSLILGFVAEPTVAGLIEGPVESVVGAGASRGISIALALALATVFQMVLGELVPKSVAIARPLPVALALAGPTRIFGVVFGPLIRFFNGAANWTVRRFGIEPREELPSVRSLPELELLFAASADQGTLDAGSSRLLRRSIRFGEKTAADVLVPRTSMVTVATTATAADVATLAAETGFSRFPVQGVDLDDIRGVVHVKSVHPIPPDERARVPVTDLMTDALVVPETREAEALLFDVQAARRHLVVVVDEYGGTAGIVTLEDLVEEIVGEIVDEYDSPLGDLTVVERPGHYLLAGTLHPDEVEEACGLRVPEGDYETLAGFVLERLGRVPQEVGDRIELDGGWELEVVELEGLRIAMVEVRAPDDAEPTDDTDRTGSAPGDAGTGGAR